MGLTRSRTVAGAVVFTVCLFGSVRSASSAKGPAGTTTVRALHDVVRLPTGEIIELRDHVLEVRKDSVRTTAPIGATASDLQRVDVRADGSMRLVFSRICPPPLTVDVASGWTRARLKAGEAKDLESKDPYQALAKLKDALALDPSQDDLRREAARTALLAGHREEAAVLLQQGIRERPAPTYWTVASDPSLQQLRADLLPRDRSTLLRTDDDGATRTVLWAPDRKWFAVAEHFNPILLLTPTGEEVFAIGITTGEDLNDSGDLLPLARKRVRDRLAQANDALAALGFQKLDGQWKDAQGPRAANRVALSTKPLTISIRENVVSLRAKGKPAVVAKLFNMGSLGIDWGFLPTTVPVVVVSWSRVAGNDECPNGRGVVVFPNP